MMVGLLLAFVVPVLLGVLLAHVLWPTGGVWRWAVKVPLGVGLGMGVTSCLFFLWRALIGEPSPGVFVVEGLAAIGLAAWVFARGATAEVGEEAQPERSRAMTVLFLLMLVLVACAWWAGCMATPNGEWDALAIWNLKAGFLFRGGAQWTDMFRPEMARSHCDYPLLLPGAVARGWAACGVATPVVPMNIGVLFGLATAGLLFAAATLLRGGARGLLAGMALLATPVFLRATVSQYADVPLCFFVLAGVALLVIHDREAARPAGPMALAGLTCALAAWTKNEGILIFALIAVARAWVVARAAGFAVWRREFGWFIVGAAPALAVLALFKLHYAAANDIVGQDWAEALRRTTDLARWFGVAQSFLTQVATMGATPTAALVPVGPAVVMLAALVLCGVRPQDRDRRGVVAAALALGAVTVAYLGVYVITPNPVSWQMDTSMGRVLMHLWPATIFLFFMSVRAPDEARQP